MDFNETTLADIKEAYLKERLLKANKYPNRIKKIKDTFENQKWIIDVTLETKEKVDLSKIFNLTFKDTENYNEKYLFLDCFNNYNAKNVHCCTLKELLELKINDKKVFKRLLRDYLVIAPLTKANQILKSISKLLNKNNKSIILLDEKDLATDLEQITLKFKTRTHLKVDAKKVIKKVGTFKNSLEVIKSRIYEIIDFLETNNYVINKIMIKPTFGKPVQIK